MQELQHWMQHNPIDPRARHRKNCLAQGTAADLTKGDKMEKPGAIAPSQGSWTSIILIYAIGVLGASTITQAIPVVADIAQFFHAGSYAGWIISAPSALVAVGALLTGWIVDRMGDKPVLILGSAIAVVGDVGVATADSLPWMLAMRVVEGVGYACISVAAIAMMTRITQGARRNIALTLWSSYIPMSFAVPLLLASQLAGTGQWRWAFSGHALVLGALLVVAVFHLRARGSKPAVSSLTGLRGALRSPALYLLGLTFACASFVQTGVLSVLSRVLADNYGVAIGVASSVGVLGMVFKIAGCLTVGPILNRGNTAVLVAASGVLLSIAGGLAVGVLLPGFLWAILVGCVFFFGAGLVVGLWALVPLAAPSRESLGAASGMVTQITLWGVLFGPPAAFAAVARGNWLWESVNIAAGGVTIFACIVLVVRRFEQAGAVQNLTRQAVHSAH